MTEDLDSAINPKAWPFEEARRLLARAEAKCGKPIILETGYGPSGLPHIGTFGEVVRTNMVRQAFKELSDCPVRLICFSDDMDGLRKVPENIPNPEILEASIGLPLTRVPDPFGEHNSFGEHNNAMLRAFLDSFGFEYEFVSATEQYRSGAFDEVLLRVLECHEAIRNIVLPTLGAERRETYSPFLPISPSSGRVLQVALKKIDPGRGMIAFVDENGMDVELPVTKGHVKLQWKVDWAMRWVALGVDYEMFGKDLIDSVCQSSKIARVLGGAQPEGFSYEHFLEANGQKISKSKGNGLSVEEWLTYASPESLSYFMYTKPRTAKRLHLDDIPGVMDNYHRELQRYPELSRKAQYESSVWHVHAGKVPASGLPIGFRMLINLASVTGSTSKKTLWDFLYRYAPDCTPEAYPQLDAAIESAIRYYTDVLLPRRVWHRPNAEEEKAIRVLRDALAAHAGDTTPETLQELVYEIGKSEWSDLRGWFRLLYRTLLGHDQGPRFGGLISVYGLTNMVMLIDRALSGELAVQKAGESGE